MGLPSRLAGRRPVHCNRRPAGLRSSDRHPQRGCLDACRVTCANNRCAPMATSFSAAISTPSKASVNRNKAPDPAMLTNTRHLLRQFGVYLCRAGHRRTSESSQVLATRRQGDGRGLDGTQIRPGFDIAEILNWKLAAIGGKGSAASATSHGIKVRIVIPKTRG